MPFPALFFYLFAGICVAAAVMVIASRNPVHSVLFLILAFANAAGLFILMGAEFLAMILIIVYVGAVLVLFLFVVMMLDVDFAELRQGFLQYLPIGAFLGIVLLIELVLVVGTWVIGPDNKVEPRTVAVERIIGQTAYLKDGVKAGERVVTDGQIRLAPGAAVNVEEPRPPPGRAPASEERRMNGRG